MGRAAGAGLVVAVLTGVAPEEALAPHADLLLESVADLTHTSIFPRRWPKVGKAALRWNR
jgi:hypothetical protein